MLRQVVLALATTALLTGFAGADCCSSKAAPKSGKVSSGWFTSQNPTGGSPKTGGDCCKGLSADSKECCKNSGKSGDAGKSCNCGDKCASDKSAQKSDCGCGDKK